MSHNGESLVVDKFVGQGNCGATGSLFLGRALATNGPGKKAEPTKPAGCRAMNIQFATSCPGFRKVSRRICGLTRFLPCPWIVEAELASLVVTNGIVCVCVCVQWGACPAGYSDLYNDEAARQQSRASTYVAGGLKCTS